MATRERTDENIATFMTRRGGTVDNLDTLVVDTVGAAAAGKVLVTYSSPELVEHVDGLWTVRDVVTGIFGTGDEFDAALEDFRAALNEHLDVLERQPSLSEDLEAQLRYLRLRLA